LPPDELAVPPPLLDDEPPPAGTDEFELPHAATRKVAAKATNNFVVFISSSRAAQPLEARSAAIRAVHALDLLASDSRTIGRMPADAKRASSFHPCTRPPSLSTRARKS
jgi:hypothetical protein